MDETNQGRTILMIVGDENRTAVPGQGTGDLFIRNRLEKVLGHRVILGVDSASVGELRSAAESADLVIVSESTTSVKLRDKLKAVTTPIISYEAFIQDEMGLTAKELPGDPGEPDKFAYGVREKDTGIDIIMPDHPLASGLKGHVTVYRESKEVTWGKVGKSAKVVATLTGKKEAAVIYIYNKGTELFDGTIAAGMRIGFFLEEENITGTSNFMTTEGLRLFDAAVKFSLGTGVVP
jgi:galactitol-specific phosphotransferase system IIB component